MTRLQLRLINSRALKLVFKTPWIGRYGSYQEALNAIPKEMRIGYDQDETISVFTDYPTTKVRPADYAFLMHLRGLVHPGGKLVDLGGSIGMACYTAQKYFALPPDFSWTVCDVPRMAEAGRQVAAREGDASAPLRFVTDLKDAGACEIFHSSGALQYVETDLPAMLHQLPSLPSTVLINRIPVWDQPEIATVQDIGFCITPYRVFNRNSFVAAMETAGYRLKDEWSCPESTFSLRFRPHIRIHAYRGFYFSR